MEGLFPGEWVGPLAGGRYLGASGGWWTAGSRGKCGQSRVWHPPSTWHTGNQVEDFACAVKAKAYYLRVDL